MYFLQRIVLRTWLVLSAMARGRPKKRKRKPGDEACNDCGAFVQPRSMAYHKKSGYHRAAVSSNSFVEPNAYQAIGADTIMPEDMDADAETIGMKPSFVFASLFLWCNCSLPATATASSDVRLPMAGDTTEALLNAAAPLREKMGFTYKWWDTVCPTYDKDFDNLRNLCSGAVSATFETCYCCNLMRSNR